VAKARQASAFVIGVAEVDAILKEFPNQVRKSLASTAFRTIGKKILQDAKQQAPKKTGQLERSLKVRALQGARRRKAGKVGASIVTGERLFAGETFYGGFLEFGTKPRHTAKPQRFVGQIRPDAFSFLRPALYRNEAYAKAQFATAVREAIQARSRRMLKKASKLLEVIQ
jgi:HK97 gp10 family phage protein